MKSAVFEEAVSPAISVILMIAVVVILAAIVGTIAFGSAGTQSNSKSVYITASKVSSGLLFTVQGGMDLQSVTSLDFVNGKTITNCTGASPKAGATCTGGTDRTGRSVIVATFADGSKQVVFDKDWGSWIGIADYGTISAVRYGNAVIFTVVTVGADSSQVMSFDVFSDDILQISGISGVWLTTAGNSGSAGDSGGSHHYTIVATLRDGSTNVTILDTIV